MTVQVKASADNTYGALQVNGVDAVTFTQNGQAGTLFNLSASVASNALNISLANTALQFRNTSLTNGSPLTAITGALSITVPTSATLGTVNSVASRLVVLVAYNAGTPVLCVTNIAGGTQLDETNLISPTTISIGATANNVIYSASAVSANSPYRVIGFVDTTQTTAGTWASAPTRIQGAGALSTAGWNSIGYGQTWQVLTGSRSFGTTYYNTTGRPIVVQISALYATTGFGSYLIVNGVQIYGNTQSNAGNWSVTSVIVPPGASYVAGATNGGTLQHWYELR